MREGCAIVGRERARHVPRWIACTETENTSRSTHRGWAGRPSSDNQNATRDNRAATRWFGESSELSLRSSVRTLASASPMPRDPTTLLAFNAALQIFVSSVLGV